MKKLMKVLILAAGAMLLVSAVRGHEKGEAESEAC